jgi:single-stranded DNA-binding protein
MKETKKNLDNNVHLYGYINDVRINKLENGRTAVNLDVTTKESYKDGAGEYQQKYSHHDAALFTSDEAVVEKFSAIASDLKANRENKDVEGYKPKNHYISLDGMLVNRMKPYPDSDKEYQVLAVMVKEDSVDIDAKLAEGEKRNRVDFSANIAGINLYEDKKFATVSMAHDYRPKDSDKQFTTWLDVRVDGKRPATKNLYEDIVSGKVGKGDFVRVGGQLHDNTYENDLGKRYGNVIDMSTFKVLKSHQAQEQKAAEKPAEKAAKKEAQKAAPKAKAESKRKKTTGQKI